MSQGLAHLPKYIANVAVFTVVALLFFAGLRQMGSPLDEGMLLAGAEHLRRGLKPGLDFNYTYGPASLWTVLATDSLFGLGLLGERLLGVAYRFAIVAGLYALARPRGHAAALGAALVGALMLGSMLAGAFAWLGAIALLLASLNVASRSFGATRKPHSFPLAGLLGALALSFRPDLAIAVTLMLLPFFLFSSWRERARFVGGVGVGLLPLAWHVVDISPRAFYEALVVEPRLMMPGRVLPLPPTNPEDRFLFFVTLGASIAWLIAGIIRVARERESIEARSALSVGLLSIALLPQVIQRADAWHIFYGAIVSVGLLPLLVADVARKLAERVAILGHSAWAPIAVIGPLLVYAPSTLRTPLTEAPSSLFDTQRDGNEVHRAGRSFRLATREQGEEAQSIVDTLSAKSREGEKLFVGPRDLRRTNYNDTYLYYLLPELVPAAYHTALIPGLDIDALAARIASADWLALTSAYDDWDEPNASMVFGSDALNRLVAERFCLASKHGSYELFERCDRAEKP